MPLGGFRAGAARTLVRVVCAAVFASLGPAAMGADADPFAPCRTRFAEAPDDYESSYCFYETALLGQLMADGARIVDALARAHPTNTWLALVRGHFARVPEPARAEALYRQSAEAFRAAGSADGELVARSTLRDFLFPRGRIEEADSEVQRVVEIGTDATDPVLKARAWTLQALHLQDSGGDLGYALGLLKKAEPLVAGGGTYRAKRVNVNALGRVANRMGRLDEALAAFRRLETLAREAGDVQTQAVAQFNTFSTLSMQENDLPTPGGRARLQRVAETALETAAAASQTALVARLHGALAELSLWDAAGRPAAATHIERCLALVRDASLADTEAVCAWAEATLRWPEDKPGVRRAAARAVAATERARNPRADAYSAGRLMRHSWLTKPREEAVRDAMSALDTIETLRDLQGSDSSAALFSAWTLDYYWLSGQLLRDGMPDGIPQAFSVLERMRARALLDAVERSQPALDARHPAVQERREALEAIAAVQRQLMSPALNGEPRRARLAELESLELREQEARRQIALAFPSAPQVEPAFAALKDVQALLSHDEAFLSFQIGLSATYEGADGGGSWLILVTRDRATAHPVPDRPALVDAVPMFVGLLAGPENRLIAPAVRLYDWLLNDAMGTLPAGVTRLIIAADGPLHRLPFESLRASPDAAPIGERFQLVYVPSATLWRQWRTSTPASTGGRTLAFADPSIETLAFRPDDTRNAILTSGLRVGPLPFARQEGRAITRHVRVAETLVGAAASEHALKTSSLEPFAILHFAAHAVADAAYPERSAVLLAPGDDREDGLLQAREIETLDLRGRIIVLSACQTAAGAVQSGEGVLSLARAFFAAGAHAVVGSRWPLRDEDAARLIDRFYRRLVRGDSLAEALAAAQRDARAKGDPATTWAGLMLIGNGDLRPFAGAAGANRERSRAVFVLTATGLAALGAGAFGLRRWRRRRTAAA
jgi:CHAT domain-containing protein